MQLKLVNNETEKLLNELGFELSTGYGMTQEVARKWIRDSFDIDVCANGDEHGWFWSIDDINGGFEAMITQDEIDENGYDNYEIALEHGLVRFCKLIIGLNNINQN